ncbi:hypothetical protein [Streptomyces virginiae]|uniref:hypothetical protein n=1 Tax=Streptomyces virginiae TaxID=1961 RepID=UPI003421DE10
MSSYSNAPVRFRSEGGAIVVADVFNAQCHGCGADTYRGDLLKWAKNHAAKCRALPRR